MNQKQTYIRCPRCELNYILKKDKFCSVCKSEMQVGGGDLDDAEMELCPICKTNYISSDEVMCPTCMQERNIDPDSVDANLDWQTYVNRDEEDDFVSPDEETGDMATVKDIDDDDSDFDDDDLLFGDEDDADFSEDDDSEDDSDFDDEDFDDDDDDFDDDDTDD
ncbi:MAG: hypothetical protein IJA69_00565, partial [Clostridia bacterium]|nr:hypothetical protein [Clostridia bacterium]